MRVNEFSQTSQAQTRGGACVLIALSPEDPDSKRCLASVRAHTPSEVPILAVPTSTAAINLAIAECSPTDVVLIDRPCSVPEGWLERLRAAARADTNTATASALADFGSELAVGRQSVPLPVSDGTSLHARPRLRRAVGPCVYVRREALELVGALDEELVELHWALELDFAQRCLLSGLAHVAAEDVLVEALGRASDADAGGRSAAKGFTTRERCIAMAIPPPSLLERYPHLLKDSPLGESDALGATLAKLRGSHSQERLAVTIDARALDGAVTGTQVHIVELINALAQTDSLHLRVLVRRGRIDPDTLGLLGSLPQTEVLAEEDLDEATPATLLYHRPQQAFAAEDVALAVRLGERVVLSQLDLIAYRNPGYFPDVDAWEDYRRASRHGLAAAERVVVFSGHTRQELLTDGLADEERVKVVAPGLDHRSAQGERHPRALEDAAEAEEALADGFMLCLGTDFRHKNRLFALRMLSALRRDFDWPGKLLLAGTHVPDGSSLELERSYLDAHPDLAKSVLSIGAIDEQEKAWLLARAGAVLYPSVYEGFGLVPFESALAGVPCLFAAQSSLAEAAPAGTATIVPWDPEASAAAAHELLSDSEARTRHVDALATAARELAWRRAATALVEVYREAAVAPPREAATLSRDAVQREGRLTEAHEVVVGRLIAEREHAQGMYDALNAEVGSGLSLIGPNGALPEGLQRALLTINAHPHLARPLFAVLARVFLVGRTLTRTREDSGDSTR